MRALALIILCAMATGCSSTKGLRVNAPANLKGDIHGDYNDLCRRMGHDPKKIGEGKHITFQFAPPTPQPPSTSGQGRSGPYICDSAGCWLGINYPGDTIYMPQGFHRWVMRHEVYHSVLRHMMAQGIDCVVPGTDITPGHWMKVIHANGTVMNARSVVETRWPARTLQTMQALVPFGMTPQEAWAEPDAEWGNWSDVMCVSPEHATWLIR